MFMAAFRACHPAVESHVFRVPRKLTRESPGMASFRSSRRLPQISSPASTLTPVMLAPGRARLPTMPTLAGSLVTATTGILPVADWKMQHHGHADRENHLRFQLDHMAGQRGIVLFLPFAGKELQYKISSFVITQPADLLKERHGSRPSSYLSHGARRHDERDAVDLRWLLRARRLRTSERRAADQGDEVPASHSTHSSKMTRLGYQMISCRGAQAIAASQTTAYCPVQVGVTL